MLKGTIVLLLGSFSSLLQVSTFLFKLEAFIFILGGNGLGLLDQIRARLHLPQHLEKQRSEYPERSSHQESDISRDQGLLLADHPRYYRVPLVRIHHSGARVIKVHHPDVIEYDE